MVEPSTSPAACPLRLGPFRTPLSHPSAVSIAPAEKVGVCGRTGCGKSTFMLALYRIVEPASGTILIDGIDVSKIGLLDLRSKLALVRRYPGPPPAASVSPSPSLSPFSRRASLNLRP